MLIFVGGHPRSGTTLLKNICTSHPDVHVTGEHRYLRELDLPYAPYARTQIRIVWDKGRNGMRSASPKLGARLGALRRWGQRGAFTARYLREVRSALGDRRDTEGRDGTDDRVDAPVIEAALRAMFPGARVVGDKWPGYDRSAERFAETPGLMGILIFRDARDVVASSLQMARTRWRNLPFGVRLSSADRAAASWLRSVEIVDRYRDRFHVIRYEDLVCRPELALDELGNFLDVDPSGFRGDRIRTTSVGRYRESLTDDESAAVMEIAGPAMERLGYV